MLINWFGKVCRFNDLERALGFWRVAPVGTANKLLTAFSYSYQTRHKTRPECSHIAQLNTNVVC